MTRTIGTATRGGGHLRIVAATARVVLSLLGFLLVAAPASAEWIARGFTFDRMTWGPDGTSLGVIGRYWSDQDALSFEDTLVVDATSGNFECVSPSVVSFVLSRDGERVFFRGRWGLYDHDLKSGRTQELARIHPFHPNEYLQLSYNRDRSAAIALRCSDWDTEISGVYAYPLDGGPAERLVPEEVCGPTSFNYFQSRRRDIPPTSFPLPARNRPAGPRPFPGSIWVTPGPGGVSGVAVWGNGAAGSDTLVHDGRAEFVSWKSERGPILVAIGPNAHRDQTTPGSLWLLEADREPVSLGEGRWHSCAWPDSTWALVLARPGRLEVVDAEARTRRPLDVSNVPEWLASSKLLPYEVYTVRLTGEFFDSAGTAMEVARLRKAGGFALDREEGGWILSLGAYEDESAARAAAEGYRRENFRGGAVTAFEVVRRPVSRMLGQFDFGSTTSPDGAVRAFFRTHPHLFQPYMTTELWIEPKGGRPRPVFEGMGSF
jgi:hypothetical protein